MEGLNINHLPLRTREHANPVHFGEPQAQPDRAHELSTYLPYKVGTSYPGKFSPAYARFFRKIVSTMKAHYLYFKPDVSSVYREDRGNNFTSMNSYSDIYYNLENYTKSLGLYKFTVAGTDHYLIIGHQLIMDVKGTILFMGVCKGYQNTLTAENFKAYVASEFFNDEVYKYVIKKIDAEYLELFRKEGVEIVIKPAQVIEDEFFGPRMVEKIDNLEDFARIKEDIRIQLVRAVGSVGITDFSRDTMQVASFDDMQFPCPIPYGYTMKNLVGTMDLAHAVPWNHGWDKKLMYVLMESEIWHNGINSWMSFDSLLKTIHENYNPDTWITIDLRGDWNERIPEFQKLRYSPATQTVQLFACGVGMNIKLKVTHRDEHILLKEEFGSVEYVTFVIEPPLTEVEEVPEDTVDAIRFDGATETDPETGQVYHEDSQGVRWTIRDNSTTPRYIAGIDPVNEESGSGSLGRGIMEQITDSGNTFVATQNYNLTTAEIVEHFGSVDNSRRMEYPLSPTEAFLRAEENSVVGQQERPEGDETGVRLPVEGTVYQDDQVYEDETGDDWVDADGDEDTGDIPVFSNEDTPTQDLPDWANERNFTNNS